jgi:hypothetical protein
MSGSIPIGFLIAVMASAVFFVSVAVVLSWPWSPPRLAALGPHFRGRRQARRSRQPSAFQSVVFLHVV